MQKSALFFLPYFVCDKRTPPQDYFLLWVTRCGVKGVPDLLDHVGDYVVGRQKRHETNGSSRDAPLADMIRATPETFVLINLKKFDTSSIVPSTPPSQSKIRLHQLNQMDDLVQLTKPICNEMNPGGRTHVQTVLFLHQVFMSLNANGISFDVKTAKTAEQTRYRLACVGFFRKFS